MDFAPVIKLYKTQLTLNQEDYLDGPDLFTWTLKSRVAANWPQIRDWKDELDLL